MADPVAVASGLVRTYVAHERRRGLGGALVDLVAPRTRRVAALDGVDLEVFPGEVVGLLGANGAGKSTLVKCLVGLLAPDEGLVRVAGFEPFRQRADVVRRVGVVFGHRTQLWWDLAVREGLDLLAVLHRLPAATWRARLEQLSDALELEPLLSLPVRELSLGQRVRCDLAAGLLHDPALLVLDEPSLGLDLVVKRKVRALVEDAASRGTAVLLATHDSGDLGALADRVVVLDAGRVGWEGSLAALRARGGGRPVIRVVPASPVDVATRTALAARLEGSVREGAGGALEVRPGADVPVAQALRLLLAKVEADDVSVQEPPLEDVLAALVEGRA